MTSTKISFFLNFNAFYKVKLGNALFQKMSYLLYGGFFPFQVALEGKQNKNKNEYRQKQKCS
jgi:hypothetical protein